MGHAWLEALHAAAIAGVGSLMLSCRAYALMSSTNMFKAPPFYFALATRSLRFSPGRRLAPRFLTQSLQQLSEAALCRKRP
jgi:hypothetical protein